MKKFHVQAEIRIWAEIQIQAKDFEDALAQARELKDKDFVDVKGEYNDGRFELGGISAVDIPSFY